MNVIKKEVFVVEEQGGPTGLELNRLFRGNLIQKTITFYNLDSVNGLPKSIQVFNITFFARMKLYKL